MVREHSGPNSIGIIDETSDVKKGNKTPGVKRQWCGTVGKKENCIVTVHLAYATGDFHCLLDGELFLPEDWSDDRDRCREAGIPDDVVYRPKWKIALELYDRARGNGVVFDWLAFDEGYGGKPEFLREMDARKQRLRGRSAHDVYRLDPGAAGDRTTVSAEAEDAAARHRDCVSGSRPAIGVENMLKYSPALRDQPWVRYRIKDGEKGPMVWEVKHTMITIKDEKGLPGMRLHLVVARNVLDPEEVKFFVSNAAAGDARGNLAAGGLLSLACGAVFRGSEAGSGADQMGADGEQ